MLKSVRNEAVWPTAAASRPGRISGEAMRHRRVAAFISVDGVRHDVLIVEASGHDLRIRTRTRIPRGKQLTVVFLSVVPTVENSIAGLVHWDCESHGIVECGVALACPVPTEFLATHPECSRSDIRFPCDVAGELEWITKSTRSACRIRNYSRDGVLIHADDWIQLGERFVLRIPNRPDLQLTGTVRWVDGQGRSCIAGCVLHGGLGYQISGVIMDQLCTE